MRKKTYQTETILIAILSTAIVLLAGMEGASFADDAASITDARNATADKETVADIQDKDNKTKTREEDPPQAAQNAAALAKYQQDLSDLRQTTLSEGDIYDDELIERYGEKWEAQFSSPQEFREMMRALMTYTIAEMPDNGWNKAMVLAHTKIHNFDTIIEKTGFGHEITSLIAAKQRLLDQYNHTEPVKRFHSWLAEKYPAPDSVEGIDQRLTEIISEPDFIRFAPDLAGAFNTLALHGNVPDELLEHDSDYWILVASISSCGYSQGCDVASLQEILDTESYKKDSIPPPDVASDWLSILLPKEFAWSETYHYTIVYGEPYTCTYGTCKVQEDEPWSVGEHNVLVTPPDLEGAAGAGHGTSNYMRIYVMTCSNAHAYNSAVAKFQTTSQPVYFTASGNGCAKVDTTVQASDRDDPHYVWYLRGITNSWIP